MPPDFYDDEDGIVYYRAGLTDNVLDRAKKKITASTSSTSKAIYGVVKTAINAFAGGILDKHLFLSDF
jgi:hypothetical protein